MVVSVYQKKILFVAPPSTLALPLGPARVASSKKRSGTRQAGRWPAAGRAMARQAVGYVGYANTIGLQADGHRAMLAMLAITIK